MTRALGAATHLPYVPPVVDIVVNRNAAQLREPTATLALLRKLAPRANVHETHNAIDLARATRRMAEHGTERVVICGGDGAVMHTITALVRVFGEEVPPIAIAPLGTVSTIARNFGIHGRSGVVSAVKLACATVPRIRPVRTLKVTDPETRIGFIFGAGLVSNFFDVYDALPVRGRLAAAEIVARLFVQTWTNGPLAGRVLNTTDVELSIDGQTVGNRWSMVAASVLTDLGLHMKVTYRADEDPNAFHTVATPLGIRDLGRALPRVLVGKSIRGDRNVDELARDLILNFGDSGGTYVFDGDRFTCNSVRVNLGPKIPMLLG